jgi:hypothetical protein
VRYGLDYYILLRRNSALKGLIDENLKCIDFKNGNIEIAVLYTHTALRRE